LAYVGYMADRLDVPHVYPIQRPPDI